MRIYYMSDWRRETELATLARRIDTLCQEIMEMSVYYGEGSNYGSGYGCGHGSGSVSGSGDGYGYGSDLGSGHGHGHGNKTDNGLELLSDKG